MDDDENNAAIGLALLRHAGVAVAAPAAPP